MHHYNDWYPVVNSNKCSYL